MGLAGIGLTGAVTLRAKIRCFGGLADAAIFFTPSDSKSLILIQEVIETPGHRLLEEEEKHPAAKTQRIRKPINVFIVSYCHMCGLGVLYIFTIAFLDGRCRK